MGYICVIFAIIEYDTFQLISGCINIYGTQNVSPKNTRKFGIFWMYNVFENSGGNMRFTAEILKQQKVEAEIWAAVL